MFTANESDWKAVAVPVLIADILQAPAGTYFYIEGVNNRNDGSGEVSLWIMPIYKAVLKGSALYLHFAKGQPAAIPLYEGESTIKAVHKSKMRAFEFYKAPDCQRVFRVETISQQEDKPVMRKMLEEHAQQHWGYAQARTTVDDDPDHDFYFRLNEHGKPKVYEAFFVDVIRYDQEAEA